MKIEQTKLSGVLVLTPKIFNDERGFFYESYSKNSFLEHGVNHDFIQDNHSYSRDKYTFRGLHYQMNPKAQTTLIRVVSGEIMDFAVDLRKNSPTYGQYTSVLLSAENHKQLLIPKGFAHGFLTLTDNVNILYKMDDIYAPEYDRILNVRDHQVDIKLGVDFDKITIAKKDEKAPMLENIENNFIYIK
ncbi:dTDP-4-dehydrorhamnose 3,5-epimerase [Sulfurimonas gotlandica GD1]|uniref:dTDP-4-dehydrorhamnose 3,5-epimerase n=1 Tax=Sulfurimonas gotlandica (strain DSM 19862 / JCM 16533 / GD1) TaxID=929558 RepID=B6BKG6_SULGG|nr:dTDP-4-dehydrorhamnose 3,5-epimerase [Sulfurimonas gotlandica]EDZ62243.1 dTDP-4-dehydrorhamnose 3,5-epimerase [Sulfurimonas gotlandica GD1]EHP29021.1 dTDP-4-dehydrorhamnose 3,5-epimerase [Sulfurimonas gotlandica GD1]